MPADVARHCRPPGGVPMLLVHATGDTVTAYDGQDFSLSPPRLALISAPDTAAFWRDANDCDAAPSFIADYPDINLVGGGNFAQYVQWSDCATGAPVGLLTILGGIHDWPVSHPGTPNPFDAGAFALDFLREHARTQR
jgi:poly(3-hydroxybutyrate) depolymerase